MKYKIEIKLELKKDSGITYVNSDTMHNLFDQCFDTYNVQVEDLTLYSFEHVYGFLFYISDLNDKVIQHHCYKAFLRLQEILNARMLKYSLQDW
jgi:hypothetical protein